MSRPPVLAVFGQVTNDFEALRRHTSNRWLYDENIHLPARYVGFDPLALAREASSAVGAECVRVDKVCEGRNNKIFWLSFEDGREAVARLPYPLAGPPHLLTSSEVATMEFAREVLKIPVPKVIAWCSRPESTSVGAEFIITEVAHGIELSKAWDSLENKQRMRIVGDLTHLHSKFFSVRFIHHGSLYFKADAEGVPHTTNMFADPAGIPEEARSKYAIGPSVNWELWRGTRKQLDTYRGPWSDCLSLVTDTIRCQQERLAKFANPRIPTDASFLDEEDASPAFHIKVLDQLISCAPATMPSPELCVPTLWHTDMHQGNIFVDPSTFMITSIIDWQWATIAPLYMQATIPRAFFYTGHNIELPSQRLGKPRLPPDFDSLSADQKRSVMEEYKDAAMFVWQQHLILEDPIWSAAVRLPQYTLRTRPLVEASRTWTDGLTTLRSLLLRMRDEWSALAGDGTPCPLQFSNKEEERIQMLVERRDNHAEMVRLVLENLWTRYDGMVSPEYYDVARMTCEASLPEWDAEAFGGPFPLQEGMRNLIAE
ncbi:hypothetical protein L226DRAFT_462197 [Lentinus tigrinus ALCF2SS1-7]|uniref:uncharacterized protein n=1 Tax=Lentinus tigrinus ALCF2SS1-7 TaxID=1328758 RepID=UPI001165DD3C|nr:hypothetical protein L226DRAFT_462197 [Lentinus tigrinus ALCF2SS1-7]